MSQVEEGGSDRTEVQIAERVDGTEVGGSANAGTLVVSQVEMGGSDRTEVQTAVGVGGTEV